MGGWALFDDAFNILFNESPLTLEDAYRCSPSTLDLCPLGNAGTYQIMGEASSLYDYPIAVLLGPICVSMGDVTAYRLGYHPTVKFFGKSTVASLGDNRGITSFPDWTLRYSIGDMFDVNHPGEYLNRKEFPIDFPVWHTKDDVANGDDAVVEAALLWMNRMVHASNVKSHSTFVKPVLDTLTITANIANPDSHNINTAAIINTLANVFVDSVPMFDDGNHSDSLAGDGLYGGYLNPLSSEDIFTISASVTDLDSTHYHILPRASRFTTIGPVVVEDYFLVGSDTIPNSGDYIQFKITLRNDGSTVAAQNISARISSLDSNITSIPIFNIPFGNIPAGQSVVPTIAYSIVINSNCPSNYNIPILVEISSGDYIFWSDSIFIHANPTGIEKEDNNLPKTFSLKQNYPNPFNPSTTIEFSIPKSEFVTLKIYNLLGQEVATLVLDKLTPGNYKYTWDASGFASGVYYYRLETDKRFVQTRKLIVLK